jgi:hypothetical protein
MSLLMEDIVAALRFSQMDIPLHEVHRLACQRARLLGEPEPTLWQVRFICDRIPEEVKLVADKRYGEFRSKRRLTYRFQFDGRVIIFQIDFTRVDVLVRDIRRRSYRKPSGEIRPYLITCMESSSRLILAWLFTYYTPNRANIATVIRDALLVSDEKPYSGIPHALWVDRGRQLISHHVQRIAKDLEFELLREFLPEGSSGIDGEGAVPYDGLHYTHELLSYWPGSPVSIRRSAFSESAAWIYLDGEILCHAHARELRRRDGSYRPFR